MRIAGIIAEYDPFHKGHAAHIAATRQAGATHIVAVISGSFTQRGEPAMFSKFDRTAMALHGGADLVLELPLSWSMAPAERFACGGIAILQSLGCVDTLSFGSECGCADRLEALAAMADTADYAAILRQKLGEGLSYAAARQAAASVLLGEEEAALLGSPNNTLGLEYIRAAHRLGAAFSFFTLKRQGAGHNDAAAAAGFASGSALREAVRCGDSAALEAFLPESSLSVIRAALSAGTAPAESIKADIAVLARLRQMGPEEFARLPYLSEGLENRLYTAAREATDCQALLEAVKTRRYPMARLRRILWAALLGMEAGQSEDLPSYIRVLGMNSRGREILGAASPTLPLIAKGRDADGLGAAGKEAFNLEERATDLRALLQPVPSPCGTDRSHKLLVLE